jgi:hypothetical protein
MRGDDDQQEGMFSYISPEKRVPVDHPLRPIRKIVDEILFQGVPIQNRPRRAGGTSRLSRRQHLHSQCA